MLVFSNYWPCWRRRFFWKHCNNCSLQSIEITASFISRSRVAKLVSSSCELKQCSKRWFVTVSKMPCTMHTGAVKWICLIESRFKNMLDSNMPHSAMCQFYQCLNWFMNCKADQDWKERNQRVQSWTIVSFWWSIVQNQCVNAFEQFIHDSDIELCWL